MITMIWKVNSEGHPVAAWLEGRDRKMRKTEPVETSVLRIPAKRRTRNI